MEGGVRLVAESTIMDAQTKTTPGGAANSIRGSNDSLGTSKEPLMSNDTSLFPSSESIPPPHPINTEILSDEQQVGDEALRLLHRLDVDFEDIELAFQGLVHRTISTALDMAKLNRISDLEFNAIVGWVFWRYDYIPTEMVMAAIPSVNVLVDQSFEQIRDDLVTQFQLDIRQKEISRLRSMPYKDYLKTDHWQDVRKAALKRADHRCQACNDATKLHVHHRTYERRGEEDPTDVVALCSDCHRVFHEHRKVVR